MDNGSGLAYAKFSGSHALGGELLAISVTAEADVDSGTSGFTSYHYITTTVEHNFNTLPILANSTGSITSSGFSGRS